MSSHAKPFPRWLDTLASFLSWRVSTGRHALGSRPATAREEFGADEKFPADIRRIKKAAPMRPEARA